MAKQKVTIITYHYVRELAKSRYPKIKGLPVDRFKKQIHHFKQNYSFISVSQLLSAVHKKTELPENSLLLTFNDNYLDHFRYVFPVLSKMKIPGLFFPEIRAVKEEIVLPNHKIHYILASAPSEQVIVQELFDLLDENQNEFGLESKEFYFKKLANTSSYDTKEVIFIKKLLQTELPQHASDYFIDRLFKKIVDIDEKVLSNELYMRKKHIRCMLRHGMHFGIIGYNHKRLPALSTDEQKKEIELSKSFLIEAGMDPAELTVSYPWGDYNRKLFNMLKANQIQAAFTSVAEIAELNHHHHFELPRFDTNHFPI